MTFLLYIIGRWHWARKAKSQGRGLLKRFLTLGLAVLLNLLSASAVYADLTIPAATTLDINDATLSVTGDITINGTLLVDAGTINLTGDWENNNVFTAGTNSTVVPP